MSLTGIKLSLNRLSRITHMGIDNELMRSLYNNRTEAIEELKAVELRVTTTGRVVTVLVFPTKRIQTPSPRRVGFPINEDMGLIMSSKPNINTLRGDFVTTYVDDRGYDRELGTISKSRLVECVGSYSIPDEVVNRSMRMLRKVPLERNNYAKSNLHQILHMDLNRALLEVPKDLVDPWLLGSPIQIGDITFFSPKYVSTIPVHRDNIYVGGFMWQDYMVMFDYHKFRQDRIELWSDHPMDHKDVVRLTNHLQMGAPVFQRINQVLDIGHGRRIFRTKQELNLRKSRHD